MINIENARRLFEQLALQTADEPGVTRASYGRGESLAHEMIVAEAQRIGLEYRRDAIGNLYITLPGRDRRAPAILFGSHLDSVPHGGNYDGAAGVVAGIAILETLAAEPAPPCDLTVMAIRAEEMIWFPEHYLGSRAAFGLLPADTVHRVCRSDSGASLAQHMLEQGFDPSVIERGEATLRAEDIRCYIELHIEQGPVLIEQNLPVGIVTGIRGNRRYRHCHIEGETTHAGGVPRRCRRDALMAGVELLSALEEKWRLLEQQRRDLVLTIGEFCTDAAQHGITKVPGRIDFTLDFRSCEPNTLSHFNDFLIDSAQRIGREREVAIDLGASTAAREASMHTRLIDELSTAAKSCNVPVMPIASGGGHDAAVFAGRGIPAAMLFVRNANGSHNPRETMALCDFAAALRILLEWTRAQSGH